MNVIDRKGGWFYYGERKWQGVESVIQSIREEVDLKETIQRLVLESDVTVGADEE